MSADLENLISTANKRNDVFYSWLRYVLLMATGSLTVLVSLNAGAGSSEIPRLLLCWAWTSLGLGILTGAICLYGEVAFHQDLVQQAIEQYKQSSDKGSVPSYESAVKYVLVDGKKLWWISSSSNICCFFLGFGLVLLIAFAWCRG